LELLPGWYALSGSFPADSAMLALVELQMSHKAIFQPETMASSDANRVGHEWMNDTADYRESELTGQYSHLCPVCGEDILFMKQDNE